MAVDGVQRDGAETPLPAAGLQCSLRASAEAGISAPSFVPLCGAAQGFCRFDLWEPAFAFSLSALAFPSPSAHWKGPVCSQSPEQTRLAPEEPRAASSALIRAPSPAGCRGRLPGLRLLDRVPSNRRCSSERKRVVAPGNLIAPGVTVLRCFLSEPRLCLPPASLFSHRVNDRSINRSIGSFYTQAAFGVGSAACSSSCSVSGGAPEAGQVSPGEHLRSEAVLASGGRRQALCLFGFPLHPPLRSPLWPRGELPPHPPALTLVLPSQSGRPLGVCPGGACPLLRSETSSVGCGV